MPVARIPVRQRIGSRDDCHEYADKQARNSLWGLSWRAEVESPAAAEEVVRIEPTG